MAKQPCRCDQSGCRPCRSRRYRARKRLNGGPVRSPECAGHFDWVAVDRAWNGQPVGRRLTRSERLYLTGLAVRGDWNTQALTRLLGLGEGPAGRKAAAAMAADVIEGRVKPPAPDFLGRV